MKQVLKRRDFIKLTSVATMGMALTKTINGLILPGKKVEGGRRVGIIGLDTSHSVAFTRIFNDPAAGPDLEGFRVTAAYPKGSSDIKISVDRIPEFTKQMEGLGVTIVSSIKELVNMVDVVLLETNDGRLHLEQSLPVLKAGKKLFIDKPLAATLKDVILIFEAARHYNVPVFSSSSLRYFENAHDIDEGKIGKITGADTFSPALLEKTHSDLFWYGVHGVEMLYRIMGTGCKTIRNIHTDETDEVIGIWKNNRVGTFRGIRSGKKDYGGNIFGEKDIVRVQPGKDYGYRALMVEVARFLKTGNLPVQPEETLEIYTFMAAAEESRKQEGAQVDLELILQKAKKVNK